ncbi:endochitinase 1 [Fusarium sp. NRRL 52700]|nr:endochitinase 1 [Fusarium sp. NRRL 52700]
MLKQLILIAPLLVQALAVPAVEPRHQHLHGHIEHTHGTKTKMTTSVRRETEQTAAPQFIPPKMPYALDPNTKIRKTTTAADNSNNPKETIVPEFIPPKMPFVAKASWQKSTKDQDSSDKSASVASVKKKTVVKAQGEEDDNNDKQPTFIPPRAPFRGSRKPQQSQAATPRDIVPQFIPPRNPWAQSKHNTRSTESDDQDVSQETAIPNADQRASSGDDEVVPAPELLRRDEEGADNEFFDEEDEDDYNPEDFPNLGGPEEDESGSDDESENTPAGNTSEQASQNPESTTAQDDSSAKNYFGGDFDDEDDANNTPTRLEARGVGKRNILYFTSWGTYGANFQPQNLPVKEITHVLYSFAKVNPKDGTVFSSDPYADTERLYAGDSDNGGKNVFGCVKQLYILKKKNRNLKVLLSIGGWNNSPDLATGVSTQDRRKKFISSAIKLITDWGFDGIDVDWEYPANAQEARNYVLILSGLRKALDQYSKNNNLNYHFMLTVATSAGPANYKVMDLKGMNPWIDAWHLMAYDYAGSWDTTTGHQANVFVSKKNPLSTKLGTDKTINDYLAAGVPPNKILMGMPLYGRSFLKTAGLGKSYSGVGGNSEGTYLYKDLPRSGAKATYNADLIASYSYDSKTRELITYDDLKSGQAKAAYINQRNLGGAFFWEASGDKVGSQSIVSGVKRTLGTLETVNNLLKYPTSAYANIRAGMPS